MGGGYYDRDVYAASASRAGGYSDAANKVLSVNKELHKSLDPKRCAEKKLMSETKHPIVFALDVTGSMGDWTKVRMGDSRSSTTSCPCSMGRL